MAAESAQAGLLLGPCFKFELAGAKSKQPAGHPEPGIGALALVPGFLLRQKRDLWTILQLFQPLSTLYSVAVLTEWFARLK